MDIIEVRAKLAYSLSDSEQMVDFDGSFGPDGSYVAVATYGNGQRIVSEYDGNQGPYTQSRESLQPDGTYRQTSSATVESFDTTGACRIASEIDGRSVVFNATLAADGRVHLDGIVSVNGQAPRDAELINAAFGELDAELTSYWNGQGSGAVNQLIAAADATDADGFSPAPGSQSGGQAGWYATADDVRFGDALTSIQSLIAGLKSGQPLPIATGVFGIAASVLRHARLDANGRPVLDANGRPALDADFPLLADAAGALGSINAAIGLREALERGDTLGAIHSGAVLARDTAWAIAQAGVSTLQRARGRRRVCRRSRLHRSARRHPDDRSRWRRLQSLR